MAISDTITSMYENVGNVYDVLELAGADLTNVDKNIFNLKQSWEERLLYFLANGTDVVWNNWLPKVTGSGETITLNNTIEAKMNFVYKGNTSQNGTPTPDAPIPVQVVSGDNTIKVEGKNLVKSKYVDSTTTNYTKVLYTEFDIKPDTTYTFSFNGTNGNIIYFNESIFTTATYITITNDRVIKTATTKSNISTSQYNEGKGWAIFKNANGNQNANVFNDLQLEKGNQATTYEPYQSQTYPINLGSIELCKIGTSQDKIYKDNGKWYLNKQIGKVVLDGSESGWVVGQYGTNSYNLPINSLKRSAGIEDVVLVLCDNFMAISYANRTTGDNIVYSDRDIQYGLYFRNTAQTSIENWKTWLSTHNTTVYYVLATPTITEITDTTLISQLEAIKKSYNTQTNISQENNDLPFELDVVALGKLS